MHYPIYPKKVGTQNFCVVWVRVVLPQENHEVTLSIMTENTVELPLRRKYFDSNKSEWRPTGRYPHEQPPPYTSGDVMPLVQGGCSSGPRTFPGVVPIIDLRQDPNFVTMGQEVFRLAKTQQLIEENFTKKLEGISQHAQQRNEEIES